MMIARRVFYLGLTHLVPPLRGAKKQGKGGEREIESFHPSLYTSPNLAPLSGGGKNIKRVSPIIIS